MKLKKFFFYKKNIFFVIIFFKTQLNIIVCVIKIDTLESRI
jgi:hypothetical protein